MEPPAVRHSGRHTPILGLTRGASHGERRVFNHTAYIALTALVINVVVAVVLTVAFRLAQVPAVPVATMPTETT